MSRARVLALGLLATLATPAAGAAQSPGTEGASLDFSGYLRSLTGVHDLGYELSGAEPRSAFNAEVLRLKWRATLGPRVTIDVHNRLQARVSSAETGFGASVAGIGVSVVPGRSLDLSTTLVEEERLAVDHDIDRLSVTVRAGAADITVGRQAITWGSASVFPVADLWTTFSPFELDTEEKPGVDAVRALAYPADGLELDLVVADRGSWEDLSAGARLTATLASADVYAAAAKLWDEVIAFAGAAVVLDRIKLRAEAALPWQLDGGGAQRPRATLGIDRPGTRLTLSGEYHYNGAGADDPEGYIAQLRDERFLRGESYFLGRHYLGGVAAWTPRDDVALAASALLALQDPSLAVTPLLSYDIGPAATLSVGTLQTFGEHPAPSLSPGTAVALRSEYGTWGDLWFTRISLFF